MSEVYFTANNFTLKVKIWVQDFSNVYFNSSVKLYYKTDNSLLLKCFCENCNRLEPVKNLVDFNHIKSKVNLLYHLCLLEQKRYGQLQFKNTLQNIDTQKLLCMKPLLECKNSCFATLTQVTDLNISFTINGKSKSLGNH